MEKITLNGKRYIALGDLERLRHNHIRDIIDKYEKDENGTIHMTEFDRGAFNALAHLMVCILEEEYHENAPDKAKCDKMIDDLRKEQFTQRWCIAGRDPDTHEQLYFRKWCPYVPKDENDDDGEDTPVMSTLKRDGKLYGDYYKAVVDLEILKRKFGNMNLRIWPGTYLSGDAERRLLEAIFGKDEEEPEGSWCIWLEPITEDDSDMWFTGWLKYRDDMPDGLKELCEKCHMKVGDSKPMFGDGTPMIFTYKGMAEKTAEKIAEVEPEFVGHLHVTECKEGNDEDVEEHD